MINSNIVVVQYMEDEYPITWYQNVIRFSEEGVIDLGICGFSKEVAFINIRKMDKESIKNFGSMVVFDITITDEKCNDSQICFNINCKFNKADLKYFKNQYGLETMEGLENFHNLLEDARQKLDLTPMEHGVIGRFEEPPLYLTSREKD